MDKKVFDDRRRIGTVKAAIIMYGEKILEGNSSAKKPQMDLPESSSRARELHKAKRDMARHKDARRVAESVKAKAESELTKAKTTVKELASQIEQSNSKVNLQIRYMEKLKNSMKCEEKASDSRCVESYQYEEVMRELQYMKPELSKLKLDIASALEEKKWTEQETEASSSKLESNLNRVEALRKEIDEVNEEQVLVELAQIEALKEFEEIKAQREKESSEFSFAMEETRKKMSAVSEEIEHSKKIESKLAVTLFDAHVLENELKLVKSKEKKVQRDDRGSFRRGKGSEGSSLLSSITEELDVAKKELAAVREEGFQFMASMDIIRNELKYVAHETNRFKKSEEKANLTVQNLKSKLLRTKSKLENATATEGNAKSVIANLSLTLDQLKMEAEKAKKEKEIAAEETANIKAEIQRTESEIDSTEESVHEAMQKLDAVKSSEALAFEKLQNIIENTMRGRASASQRSSSITISKFEYEYLTAHAAGAEAIADKKVAAAQAWIEALKASEKETLMKIETAHREIRETTMEEEQEVYRTERSLAAKRRIEGEVRNRWRQKGEQNPEAERLRHALPRKSVKGNGILLPSRRAKLRTYASPSLRKTPGSSTPRSTSFTIKKKKKMMPNLAKFFGGKRIGKDI